MCLSKTQTQSPAGFKSGNIFFFKALPVKCFAVVESKRYKVNIYVGSEQQKDPSGGRMREEHLPSSLRLAPGPRYQ